MSYLLFLAVAGGLLHVGGRVSLQELLASLAKGGIKDW